MNADAVVFEEPGRLEVRPVALRDPGSEDVLVRTRWSGVSTGTERLLWTGRMPPFPGLGYPLIPGYEAVGTVVRAGPDSGFAGGETVFVPGTTAWQDVRGLFGATGSDLVVEGGRCLRLPDGMGEDGALMALAATAYHALALTETPPELIVGHGALGRLLARLIVASGHEPPTVWERNPVRQDGARGYPVLDASDDDRHDYGCIVDVSGDAGLLDTLIQRSARGGTVVLAGFYDERVAFDFPPAFIKEVTLQIAAEWSPPDLAAVGSLVMDGSLELDGLVTHRVAAGRAADAYRIAFDDPTCVKMTLDWSRTA